MRTKARTRSWRRTTGGVRTRRRRRRRSSNNIRFNRTMMMSLILDLLNRRVTNPLPPES
jgi:hypothetical protein